MLFSYRSLLTLSKLQYRLKFAKKVYKDTIHYLILLLEALKL